jgi:hypothetical protein
MLAAYGFDFQPLDTVIAERAAGRPPLHADPFDRNSTALAQRSSREILTSVPRRAAMVSSCGGEPWAVRLFRGLSSCGLHVCRDDDFFGLHNGVVPTPLTSKVPTTTETTTVRSGGS